MSENSVEIQISVSFMTDKLDKCKENLYSINIT